MKRYNIYNFSERKSLDIKKLIKLSEATKNTFNCSGAYFDIKKNRYVKVDAERKKWFKKQSNHRLRVRLRVADANLNDYDNYFIINHKKNYNMETLLYW